LTDTDGVGVWPCVSSWMQDESRSRSRPHAAFSGPHYMPWTLPSSAFHTSWLGWGLPAWGFPITFLQLAAFGIRLPPTPNSSFWLCPPSFRLALSVAALPLAAVSPVRQSLQSAVAGLVGNGRSSLSIGRSVCVTCCCASEHVYCLPCYISTLSEES